MTTIRFTGTVVEKTSRAGLAALRVEARDVRRRHPVPIAVTRTGDLGEFSFEVSPEELERVFGDAPPILTFAVTGGGFHYGATDRALCWEATGPGRGVIEVESDTTFAPAASPLRYEVHGVVADGAGTVQGAMTVKLYYRSMSSVSTGIEETLVGTTVTSAQGAYRIAYDLDASLPNDPHRVRPDLVVKAVDGAGVPLGSSLVCGATPRARVDVTVGDFAGGRYPGPTRYAQALSAFADYDLVLKDLTDDHVTFLSCRTGASTDELSRVRSAAKLKDLHSGVAQEVFYGLLQQGLPEADVFKYPLRHHRSLLLSAVASRVVSPSVATALEDHLDQLEAAAVSALTSSGTDELRLGQLAALAVDTNGKRDAFVKHALRNEGQSADLWAAVAADTATFTSEEISKLRFAVDVAPMAGFWPNTITELFALRAPGGTAKDLAALTHAQWTAVVDAAGFPPGTPGTTPTEQKANYVETLKKMVDQRFRTAYLAARVKEGPASPLKKFFDEGSNSSIDFATKRASRFLAEDATFATLTEPEKATATADLLAYERLQLLTEGYGDASALFAAGYKSASAIKNAGESAIAGVLGPSAAKTALKYACWTSGAAVALHGKLSASFATIKNAAFADAATPSSDPGVGTVLPDWSSLFGSLSACACEHCMSVIGPGAYLVDLLRFLGQVGSPTNAQQALLALRPDLKRLGLSCANTDTPIPYVDLVNEILEVKVAIPAWPTTPDIPDSPDVVDTVRTGSELGAHPELVYPLEHFTAYNALADAVYPFSSPFHLWVEEARVYLAHLGLPRHILIERLAPSSPDARALASERLDLSPKQYDLLVGTSPPPLWQAWGFASPLPDATLVSSLSVVSDFLAHAGITYEELRELMECRFSKAKGIAFPANAPSTVEGLTLESVDVSWLDDAQRLLRLQRRMGWSITDTGKLFSTFPSSWTVRTKAAGAISRLLDVTGLEPTAALAWFADLDTTRREAQPSFYDRLFLNKRVANPDEPIFEDLLASPSAETLNSYSGQIMAGLRLSGAEFRLLTDAATAKVELALSPVLDGASVTLSVASLSRLFRLASAARALRLGVRELLALRMLANVNLLAGDDASAPDPETALTFIRLVDKMRDAGLAADEIHYLVRHVAATSAGLTPTADTLATWDLEITDGVKREAQAVLTLEDPGGEALEEIASQLLNPTQVTALLGLANRTALAQNSLTFLDDVLAPYLDSVVDAKAQLVNPATGTQTVVGLLTTVEERRTYLARRLQRYASSAAFVKSWAASTFELEPAVVHRLLVESVLTHGGRSAIFALIPAATWDAPTSTAQHRERLYVLLQKTALLVRRLALSPSELQALYPAGGGADPGGLPHFGLDQLAVTTPDVDAGLTEARQRFTELVRLCDYVQVRAAFPGGAPTLLQLFVEAQVSLAAAYDFAASSTGWSRDDITSLAVHLGLASADAFRNEVGLARLAEVMPMLRRLGASASQAIAWATYTEALPAPADPETPASNAYLVARDIKRIAAGRHSAEEWEELARPIRNVLRERQRQVLVDRLIGHEKTRDELFMELLIDVEMSPCQLTSRIVQAQATVQQFMSQVLLNLVSGLQASESAAREWKWMKNFRVWEANRKVFLWPENWIEAELRDDKTPEFRALETALLKGPLDDALAEDAFREYADKLAELDALEVIAVHNEEPPESPHFVTETPPTLHVFGRSRTKKQVYHRTRTGLTWTPWTKVELDIDSQHLVPVTLYGRLYLFWFELTERQLNGFVSDDDPPLETGIRLHYAELRPSGWVLGQVPSMSKGTGGSDRDAFWLGQHFKPEIVSFTAEGIGETITIHCQYSFQKFFRLAKFVFYPGRNHVWATAETGEGAIRGPFNSKVEGQYAPRLPANQGFLLGDDPVDAPNPVPGRDLWLWFSDSKGYVPLLNNVPITQGDSVVVMERLPDPAPAVDVAFLQDFTHTRLLEAFTTTTAGNADVVHYGPQNSFPALQQERRFRVEAFCLPYIGSMRQQLALRGVEGLLRWADQDPKLQLQNDTQGLEEDLRYVEPVRKLDVDFRVSAPMGVYNWELFFHAPFLIATRLMKEGRHEEAQRWLNFIFDPTDGSPEPAPRRYWKVKPFYENADLATIQEELLSVAVSEAAQELEQLNNVQISPASHEVVAQIAAWRADPFDPHAIARLRVSAYQKAVFIRYVENLVAWGDQLFAQDTREAVNEAAQLYVLASRLLGERPVTIRQPHAPAVLPVEDLLDTDAFGNQLVGAEVMTPRFNGSIPSICGNGPPPPRLISAQAYFCVPGNAKLLGLWDAVSDRLFKIRHCQNIEGVTRSLPLFQPPIDPALLVRATAAGVDIASVLYDLNTAAPPYRYSVLFGRAVELTQGVVSLGASLLSTLEKGDAEQLGNLRASHETALHETLRETRKTQLNEAKAALRALEDSRRSAQERERYFSSRERVFAGEQSALELADEARDWTMVADAHQIAAGVSHFFANLSVGSSSFATFGGSNIGSGIEAVGRAFSFRASQLSYEATTTEKTESYKRRFEDWQHQAKLATLEIEQIEKQILTAQIRVEIAAKELATVEQQLTQSREVEQFLRSKFTSQELYGWMKGELLALHYDAYRLAYDVAKRAQRAFQYERGDEGQTFIGFDQWSGAKNGLLAGERLLQDLRKMDAAYIAQNKRELELTKMVSLAEHDPEQLVALRDGIVAVANITLTEDDYDRDFTTHYLRRFKSIGVTIPCTSGPHQGVLGTLTLLKGETRRRATDDEVDQMTGVVQSVVTSHGQSDSGLFELVFKDERFLPFEGVGAHLETGTQLSFALSPGNRFDYRTIDDLVLEVRYTARSGRSATRPSSRTYQRLVRVRDEFATAWQAWKSGAVGEIALPLVASSWTLTKQEVLGSVSAARVDVWAASALANMRCQVQSGALTDPPASGARITFSPVASGSAAGDWDLSFVEGETSAAISQAERDKIEEIWLILDYNVTVSS